MDEIGHVREIIRLEIARVEGLIDAERALRLARRQDDLTAVDKAAMGVEHRLESMNEFREQLRAQAATFVTRDTLDGMSTAREQRFSQFDERFRRLENAQARMGGAVLLVSALLPLVVILGSHFLNA